MKRVIIADDNEDIRLQVEMIVRDYFSDKGLEVEVDSVDDGRPLIEKVIAGNYDLVITDNVMEKFSGLLAIMKIRDAGVKIPIYMMSSDTSIKDDVLSLGATGFVEKGHGLSGRIINLLAECFPYAG